MVRDVDYLPPLGESDQVCIQFNVKCTQSIESAETEKRYIFKANYTAMIEKQAPYDWDAMLTSNFEDDSEPFIGILELLLEQ